MTEQQIVEISKAWTAKMEHLKKSAQKTRELEKVFSRLAEQCDHQYANEISAWKKDPYPGIKCEVCQICMRHKYPKATP